MKEILFDALTRQTPQDEGNAIVDRRTMLKFGATTLGVLAGASSALGFFPRLMNRGQVVPEGPPLQPLPPPLADIPPLTRLTFEGGAGVGPNHMLRMVQDYVAITLSPDYARQIVQIQVQPAAPTVFHHSCWSDYRFFAPFPPTRTRFGYFVAINQFVLADGRLPIREYQDMNYFEMRRVINPSEMATFGMPLVPFGFRRSPTMADMDGFYRVSRQCYGIPNPEAYTMICVRQFTNGRQLFNSYLIARGPELRSPFKDLLIDNVPMV